MSVPREYLSKIGRKGGRKGGKAKGKCKVRGTRSYYRRLRKLRTPEE